jgi:hypothetical protein
MHMKSGALPVLLAVISFGPLASAGAQKDLPVPRSPAAEYPLTITGCIHGTRLIPQSSTSVTASDAVNASEYVLDGPKALLSYRP